MFVNCINYRNTTTMKEITDTLLLDFLAGNTDPLTSRQVEEWYDQSEVNRHHLESLYLIMVLDQQMKVNEQIDDDAAFRSLERKIQSRQTFLYSQAFKTIFRYVALLCVGLISVATYFFVDRSSAPEPTICRVEAKMTDCKVTLPDGSTVLLHKHSLLQYPSSFDDECRKVNLVGGAFFDVKKHQNNIPFAVKAVSGTQVLVHGTRFDLKAYDDQSNVETVLVEGSVDFITRDKVVRMRPNQKVSYNPKSHLMDIEEIDPHSALSGDLRQFKHLPLLHIIGVINRSYESKIRFSDAAIGEIIFTGTLDFDMPLKQILEVITLTTGTSYINRGDEVLIRRANP